MLWASLDETTKLMEHSQLSLSQKLIRLDF